MVKFGPTDLVKIMALGRSAHNISFLYIHPLHDMLQAAKPLSLCLPNSSNPSNLNSKKYTSHICSLAKSGMLGSIGRNPRSTIRWIRRVSRCVKTAVFLNFELIGDVRLFDEIIVD